jgi:cytidylate kinase
LKDHREELKKKIVICISGMTGSGKSTVAKRLADKYGLDYFSGGNALKSLAQDEGYDSDLRGWWESPQGLKFLQQRMSDPTFDKKIDEKLLELAEKGDVVLDSWTMPWLFDGGFKIWLEASLQVRAKRVMERDDISDEEAVKALKEKDEKTRAMQ